MWVKSADDFPKARALLKDIGIEPVVRFREELQLHRQPDRRPPAQRTASRVRLMALAIVAGVMLIVVLKATQVL